MPSPVLKLGFKVIIWILRGQIWGVNLGGKKKTNKRTCLISQWGSVPFGLIHNSSIMRLMEVLSISSLRAFIMEREGGKSVAGRAVGRDELGDWA